MKGDKTFIINGKEYVIKPEFDKPPTPPLTLRKTRFGKEWLIARIWFGVAKEKEISHLIKKLNDKEKEYKKLNDSYNKKLDVINKKIPVVRKNSFFLFFKRLSGYQRERALIFDDDGFLVGIKSIKPEDNVFSFRKYEFTLEREKNPSKLILSRFLERETFYFFNMKNSGALSLTTPLKAQYLAPDALYSLLNTRQLINLHSAKGLLGGLNLKTVLILGGVLLVAYFLLTGGLNPPA
jgi:hypothetical protein